MLDFGWAELLFIIAICVLVIGPDEIPAIMRSLGRIVRRLQYMRFALTQQFDDFMKDSELEDIQNDTVMQPLTSVETEKEIDKDQADDRS